MEGTRVTRVALVVGVMVLLTSVWLFSRQGTAQEPPNDEDCPNASQLEQFTQTGDFTTDFFDSPTGQFVISHEFPNALAGIVQRLGVQPEREGGEIGALSALGPQDLEPNQGIAKLEDIPGRYRLELSPSDPDQEYVVVVYGCDTSGGESTIPRSTSPSPAPKASSPAPKTPPPPPKTPSPPPSPRPDDGVLMNAGAPRSGPVPIMPDGSCPREFPDKRTEGCYPA